MARIFEVFLVPFFRTIFLGIAILTATSSNAKPAPSSQVKMEKTALPARFNAPLPVTIVEMDNWAKGSEKFPPQSHVVDTVSFGQLAMFRRIEVASRAVPAAQRTAWSERWYKLLEYQISSPAFCALARPVMRGPKSTLRMAIAGSFVRDCFKPEDRALVLRKDTPNRVVLDYFDSYRGPARKGIAVSYDDRLASAAEDTILNGKNYEARGAAYTLIEQKNERAEAALFSIHRRLKDVVRKDDIAFAFLRGNSPEGKRIGQEVCVRKKTDPMCSNSDPLAGYTGSEEPPKPSAAAIQASKDRLAEMGFSKVESLDLRTITSDSAEAILLEAGYGYGFDVETGLFPNGHDTLLRNLAKLTSPALDAVVFEEIAPIEYAAPSAPRAAINGKEYNIIVNSPEGVMPYQLHAYLKGKRYSIAAQNLGDWYDVDAVLKLLEFILADQKLAYRLIPLPTGDQTLTIIGGPATALERALEAKLIDIGDAGRAEELGKGFENEVLETLRKL